MRSFIKRLILLIFFINHSSIFSVDEKEDFVYDLSLATLGISVSQYNTGVNYSLGRGIDRDMEKAVYWYQRANEQGHSKAPFNIAIIYSDGIFLEPDPTLAIKYFLIAEERNNKEAKIFLNKLRSFKNLSIEAALSLNCCPKPLVHSMVKN